MSEGTFNFDVKFNEAVALFEGIEHIEIDDDGVIHAYMASGEVVDYNQIKDLFELSGGIIFKGIINSASELPASHLTGWMYMIGTAGRYISQVCEPGDIIICIADGEVSSDADWTIVQTNLNPNLFAPITSPEFQGTISLGRKSGTTKGSSSVAVGSNVEASAYTSHAEGHNTKATADHAHAEGYWTTASGEDSHAEGNTTTASGRNAHAEGGTTTASGENSHAEGGNAKASGYASHAEGVGTIANHYSQHAGGEFNVADPSSETSGNRGDHVEIIGNGVSTVSRSNARSLDWNGNERLAGDVYINCNSDSTGGTALGAEVAGIKSSIGTVPSGKTVEGQISTLDSDKAPKASPVFTGSISLGRKENTTVGTNSFAVGNDVEASGNYSHAEGSSFRVSSYTNQLRATGDYSHAEGAGSEATGVASHAEGLVTTASGAQSHSEGSYTNARGAYSHSEGRTTSAQGEASHSEGLGTIALGDAQHVGGKYNVTDSTSLEIIGNGTGSDAKKNARLLDANGNERLAGDIYVNCNDDSTGGTALGDAVTTLNNNKAPKESPAFTGTPTAPTPTVGDNSQKIATTAFVMNAFTENDAMLYKGVVNANTDLPATHKVGWTYKVGTAGSYAGKTCEVGDMIICNTDGTAAADAHWDVIQTNINGAVTGPASATNNRIALFDGTTGKIIKQSSYTAGAAAAKGVDTSFSNTSSANLPTTAAVAEQLDLKANVADPVFTGSISLGRSGSVGENSFASGYVVQATGTYSHAEGFGSQAQGLATHAEGMATIAQFSGQHAGGRYNVADNSSLEIIGNGSSTSARKNARLLDFNGNERLAGDVYINCNDDSTGGTALGAELSNVKQSKADIINVTDSTSEPVKTLTDGADGVPMRVTFAVEPKQDLHGQTSPYPGGGGKNLLETTLAKLKTVNTSGTWTNNNYTVNGITFTINDDGTVNASGTATQDAQLLNYIDTSLYYGDLKFFGMIENDDSKYNVYVWDVDADGRAKKWDGTTNSGNAKNNQYEQIKLVQNHATRIVCRVHPVGQISNVKFYPMLVGADVTDTSFATYSNICPISGWTKAELTGTGKNFIDLSLADLKSGYCINNNGVEELHTQYSYTQHYYKVNGGGTVAISFDCSGTSQFALQAVAYDAQRNYIDKIGLSVSSSSRTRDITWLPEGTYFIRFNIPKQYTITNMMLEYNSMATDYEPFGATNTIQFGETVHGGTLTVNKDGTGSLVVDLGIYTIDSEHTVGVYGIAANMTFCTSATSIKKVETSDIDKFISNMFKAHANSSVLAMNCEFTVNAENKIIVRAPNLFTTVDEANAYFATNPMQVVAPLVTPVTIPLSVPQVKSLLGVNNIYADTGNILSVDYSADTKLYVDNLFASLTNATGVSF